MKAEGRKVSIFSAFRHYNYRLWFAGQLISLFGTWMQGTAQGFLVFELTHSPAWLGYVGFAAGIPVWLFSSWAGSLADRYPKRTILMTAQISMMILAFSLAILTFLDLIHPVHLIIFSFLLGVANTFDAPARQAFVVEMVGKDDLMNAIALNSGMVNGATAVGPAFAGVTYALFGPAWCFAINGVSFIGVIGALMFMRLQPFVKAVKKKSVLHDILDGFRYIRRQPVMLGLILVVAFSSSFGLAFATLFPAWAVKILHGDAATNGFMQSARGAGSMLAALMVAAISRLNKMGKVLTTSLVIFPVFLLLFSLAHALAPSLIVLFFTGIFLLFVISLANGLIQTNVADEYRGRVMGVHTMTFFGMMPVGALIYGQLAQHFGEVAAVQVSAGVLLVFAAMVFWLFPKLREV